MTLRYLETFRARGKLVAYYRRDGARRRLLDPSGSPVDARDEAAVVAAWQQAHDAAEAAIAAHRDAAAARAVRPRSIADLIDQYRQSDLWANLAPATRTDYEKGLAPLARDWGALPVAGLRRHHVGRIRARYAWREAPVDRPEGRENRHEAAAPARVWNGRQANRVVTVLSILMSYAVDDLGWRQDNPALRPRRLRTEGDGYRPWTQAEFLQFHARSAPAWRFAGMLALLGAQRGQDQVKLRWADYEGGGLWVTQQKTGARIWVECAPALAALLEAERARRQAAASEIAALTILVRPDGRAWGANAFQKAAGQAIRAAGLTGVVWHGLRGTAASWAADGGASEKGIQALLGHRSASASQRYARGADDRRLAAAAARAIVLPFAPDPAPASRPGKRRRRSSERGGTA